MKTTAREFAIQKHGDQKYGDQPYVVHLDHVHEVLSRYYPGIMQAYRDAAYLHDVLEDTETTVEELGETFGTQVPRMVPFCTDSPGHNRKARKQATYARCRAELDVGAIGAS